MTHPILHVFRRALIAARSRIERRSQTEPAAPAIPSEAQLKREQETADRLRREGQRAGRCPRGRQQGQANPRLAQQIDYWTLRFGPQETLRRLSAIGQRKKGRQ